MRKKRAHGLLVGLACALAASACGGGDGDANSNSLADVNTNTSTNTNASTNSNSNAHVETKTGATETHAPSAPAANANAAAAEGGGQSVEGVLAEVASFTDELLKRIDDGADASAGVAEAQKFFDARAAEVRARILAAKTSAQASAGARRSLLESEVDNSARVSNLQTKYLDRSMSDAAFKVRLDKLVGDYRKLFE